eukprot:128581-Pelagomonas_calceolata.AAC.1
MLLVAGSQWPPLLRVYEPVITCCTPLERCIDHPLPVGILSSCARGIEEQPLTTNRQVPFRELARVCPAQWHAEHTAARQKLRLQRPRPGWLTNTIGIPPLLLHSRTKRPCVRTADTWASSRQAHRRALDAVCSFLNLTQENSYEMSEGQCFMDNQRFQGQRNLLGVREGLVAGMGIPELLVPGTLVWYRQQLKNQPDSPVYHRARVVSNVNEDGTLCVSILSRGVPPQHDMEEVIKANVEALLLANDGSVAVGGGKQQRWLLSPSS